MTAHTVRFDYYPHPLDVTISPIDTGKVRTVP